MYHSQTFLKKIEYKITEEKKENLINDHFDSNLSGNESDKDESNDWFVES